MFTERISRMAAHLAANRGDKDCKRRLTMATVSRRKLLAYMQRTDYSGYRLAVRELGLRPLPIFHSSFLPKVSRMERQEGRKEACFPYSSHYQRAEHVGSREGNGRVSHQSPASPFPPMRPHLPFPSQMQVRTESHKIINARNRKLKNRLSRGWAGH